MEYELITGTFNCFHQQIKQHLSEGWTLYHGPFHFGTWNGCLLYAQAMTRQFTEPFQVVTVIEGEWNAQAEICEKYGYFPIGEPQRTGKIVKIDGDEYPEVAVILMKKEDV